MLEEKTRRDQNHHESSKEKESVINSLETRLLEKEEEHQRELTNILNKSSEMRNQQIAELTTQLEELRQDNASQKLWWSNKLTNHDIEVANVTRKHEE